jgi:signal transduction histidine kinase
VILDLITDAEFLILRVQDSGLGIAPEDQVHVFEPFYRCSQTEWVRGSGLGLTIVKQAIEALQGSIDLQSRQGEGTTFTVRLPLRLQQISASESYETH